MVHGTKKQPTGWFFNLVRMEGIEPPRLSTLEPKSSASTSSATSANTN